MNNRIKELSYRIYTPVTVRFVDITSFEGIRVYQRTAWFLAAKGRARPLPRADAAHPPFDGPERLLLRDRRHRLLLRPPDRGAEGPHPGAGGARPADPPHEGPHQRGAPRYAEEGFTDKIALLDSRPRLYSDLYTLDDTAGYFYGSLAPSTGYVRHFDIEPYYNGFYLALPLRTDPDRIVRTVHQDKMFGIFREYQSWVRIMGVPTVGDVNAKVLAGDAGGMIKLAEAFHERKFAEVADAILQANLLRGTRVVLISGPSSSGKTTSAKRLGIQLGVLGLNPVLISLDDYFVDREKTPKDADGEYDYEALEAIDLDLFNDPSGPAHARRERRYSALRLHHGPPHVAQRPAHARRAFDSWSSKASTD